MKAIKDFIKNLLKDAPALLAWLINELTLSGHFGLADALRRIASDPTNKGNWFFLAMQLLWAGASAKEIFKVAKNTKKDVEKRKAEEKLSKPHSFI